MRLVWLARAVKDRADQLGYVALTSPRNALDLGDRIAEHIPKLKAYPDMGRTGRVRGTRELVINHTPFILVYRVKAREGRLEILRLLHGAQKYP